MLSFTEFKNEVSKNIKSALSEEYADYEVVTNTINKDTGSYEGISVRPTEKGVQIYPTVSLNDFYNEYIKGKDIEECIEGIAKVIDDNSNPEFAFNPMDIVFWEKASARIVPTLMNIPNNEEYLADKIRRDISDDMTIIFSVVISEGEGSLASAKITTDILNTWGVSADELYDTAISNLNNKDYSIFTMFNLFDDDMPINNLDDIRTGEPMYILTNGTRHFGASTILRSDIMEKLYEKFGNYYIIPSSVHEVIIVPTDDDNTEKLVEMLRDINDNTDIMNTCDILSYKVYRYDRETKKIVSI